MTRYVALLRAVNVGGTGKLPMTVLKAMCEAEGWANVRTFIASGNVLLDSDAKEADVKARLEARLEAFAGKPIPVFVRTAAELIAASAANPFVDAHPSRCLVYFQNAPPPDDLIAQCRDQQGERIALGTREFYIDYGEGIRHTRLKIPNPNTHTGRSANTVARLVKLVQE